MSTSTTSHFSSSGPYFCNGPTMLGKDVYDAEVQACGAHHPDAMLAGGRYAIGLGAKQTRQSLCMLREAEYWLRSLGEGCEGELGLNLAAQGLGLCGLNRPGLAVRRLREALSLLKSVGYEHSEDILLVIAKLAEAELGLYGPLAGLNRLNQGRALLHRSGLNTLYEVATVRIQVLADFYKDGHRPICEQYAGTGGHQRDTRGVMELVEATSDAIRMLLTAGNRWSAVRIASACLHELLDNRRLTAGDLLAALSLLDRDIDDLEKSNDALGGTDPLLEALEAAVPH